MFFAAKLYNYGDRQGKVTITLMKKILTLSILLFACIGCDQSTKYTAKHFLEGKETLSYMGDLLRLSYTENTGTFLGLGASMPENIRHTVFVILVSIFLLGFMLFVILSKKLRSVAVASSGLIIGGGLSNLIDRIINQGAVIDFMNIGVGSLRTGIFNVADVATMVGVFVFVIFMRGTA
jgi:signal peptidase II